MLVSPRKCVTGSIEMIVHTVVFAVSMQSYIVLILPILTLPHCFMDTYVLQNNYGVLQARNGMSATAGALSPILLGHQWKEQFISKQNKRFVFPRNYYLAGNTDSI